MSNDHETSVPGRPKRWIAVVASAAATAIVVAVIAVVSNGDDQNTSANARVGGEDDGAPAPRIQGWRQLESSPLEGRNSHALVWTGEEMLVWGGFQVQPNGEGRTFADGAAYNPASGKWRMLSDAPLAARAGPFGFWTGKEMLLWGGPSPVVLAEPGPSRDYLDGALHDPVLDRWRKIPDAPLSPRSEMGAIFAGGRLIVWGGRDSRNPNAPGLADGAAYDPATNRWSPVPEGPLPGRIRPSIVALGDRVLIWGGNRIGPDGNRVDGATYDPATEQWTRIADAPHPAYCFQIRCVGTWTGSLAVFLYSPLAYDPSFDGWIEMAECAAAQERASGQSSVWTGDHLIAWGGRSLYGDRLPGAVYHPPTDRWTEIADDPRFPPRIHHEAVWTGSEMIIWGGISGAGGERTRYHDDGAAYSPGNPDTSSIQPCRPVPPPPPVD